MKQNLQTARRNLNSPNIKTRKRAKNNKTASTFEINVTINYFKIHSILRFHKFIYHLIVLNITSKISIQ